jgi:hypothetical protein
MSERKESAGPAKKTDKADDGAKKAAAGKAKAKERAEAR